MFDVWLNCKTFVHSGKNQIYVVHWIQKLRLRISKIKTFSARYWTSKEITLTSYHVINSFPRWSKINFVVVLIEREREVHTHTHTHTHTCPGISEKLWSRFIRDRVRYGDDFECGRNNILLPSALICLSCLWQQWINPLPHLYICHILPNLQHVQSHDIRLFRASTKVKCWVGLGV